MVKSLSFSREGDAAPCYHWASTKNMLLNWCSNHQSVLTEWEKALFGTPALQPVSDVTNYMELGLQCADGTGAHTKIMLQLFCFLDTSFKLPYQNQLNVVQAILGADADWSLQQAPYSQMWQLSQRGTTRSGKLNSNRDKRGWLALAVCFLQNLKVNYTYFSYLYDTNKWHRYNQMWPGYGRVLWGRNWDINHIIFLYGCILMYCGYVPPPWLVSQYYPL